MSTLPPIPEKLEGFPLREYLSGVSRVVEGIETKTEESGLLGSLVERADATDARLVALEGLSGFNRRYRLRPSQFPSAIELNVTDGNETTIFTQSVGSSQPYAIIVSLSLLNEATVDAFEGLTVTMRVNGQVREETKLYAFASLHNDSVMMTTNQSDGQSVSVTISVAADGCDLNFKLTNCFALFEETGL